MVRKPIKKERLIQAFEKAAELLQTPQKKDIIEWNTNIGKTIIFTDQIAYIKTSEIDSRDKDIILNDLKVVYENGDKLSPTIGDKIAADQYSREIELGPEGKSIRSIEFKFRSTGNLLKGRANVLVYGKRYTQPY